MICLHRATTAAGGRKLQCNTYARQSLGDGKKFPKDWEQDFVKKVLAAVK
jgi:hypothetical protein